MGLSSPIKSRSLPNSILCQAHEELGEGLTSVNFAILGQKVLGKWQGENFVTLEFSLVPESDVFSCQILPLPNLRIFSFAELKVATRNFRQDTVLGEGGFGKVYKGWLDEKANSRNGSGTVVAIKRLMGYCWEETELLLVYEFMQKGSLENHLFGRGSAAQPLPWDLRIKVLIGAARGLAFLHTSEKQVIYRDFKASNILLDGVSSMHLLTPFLAGFCQAYNAKISDFGLAKMGPSASQSHVTTRVMGTYGYAAPEYVATGHLYVKSDVYGFGVVLVEMLTGLRALDTNRPSGQHTLVDWIKPILADRRKLKNIMDSRLEGKYPSKASVHIAQLALTCLGPEPKTRPPMKEVVETLERVGAVNERPRRPRVSSSHTSTYRIGQQPLHQRSPLRSRQDVNRSYQNSPQAW
ncbi:hypothetical protein RJ640_026931 [Escallonia rubra]|uniref:Protein kinase domain-containing protein n=1 Tax=Escallonia rubra TaxID=112253 RepID=A0AA88RFG5_9ASTE|nr:hypothetical protein RJ640_026931 [Escallonia rubra]